MSDNQTTEPNFNDEDESSSSGQNWRRDLEARLAAEKQRADTAERNFAFKSVQGLDVENNPLHKFFADKYEGALDPAEVAKAAAQLGVIQNGQTQTANTDAVEQQTRFDNASQGAAPAEIQGSDEAKLNAILNGNFNSLAEYENAVKDAGYAKNLLNG